jgi:predicted PurR-regulated permease PerM
MPIADTAEEINKLNEFIQAINTLQGNERNTLIVIYLIITIASSIITLFVNYLIQSNLNKKTNKYDKEKIKIERKLEHIENLYKWLTQIKNNAILSNRKEKENAIKKVSSWVSSHRIMLTKSLYNKTTELLDYYTDIISNPGSRNIKKEEKMFSDFIEEYNKV